MGPNLLAKNKHTIRVVPCDIAVFAEMVGIKICNS
jgi:hypothetical protein